MQRNHAPLINIIDSLPVLYQVTKTTWFNQDIFRDQFHHHFLPAVINYQEMNEGVHPEDMKAIILLDNTPAHPV